MSKPFTDTILNPMDSCCPARSIFNDCRTHSEFTAATQALIPSDGGSSESFWALAARTLFIEMCIKLQERGQTTNLALSENLMTADLKRVHRFLQNTIADPLTAPERAITPLSLAGGVEGGLRTIENGVCWNDSPTPNPSRKREGDFAGYLPQRCRI